MTEEKKNQIYASLLELNFKIHEDEVIATNDNDFENLKKYNRLRQNISDLLDYIIE